jgi:hypothetical protein
MNIVIRPITIHEKIPKHDDDHGNRQGEIIGVKIGRENWQLQVELVEEPFHRRFQQSQQWNPYPQSHQAHQAKNG